ncbi:nuclease-related domain-containing protein [Marmoricola sp. URHB0036]|uniref:nuclease-related domain-containing protein n=1 Tax=Marmoricola sp. URHB0036 TaxID=1298863 RepID=UPI00048A3E43|nr:nuclease-related domain-containing protein [Marmoricola sp. URHB0036]
MSGISASAGALTALPAGRWRVLHRVHGPDYRRVNVDHVVVGPAGVFVIASERTGLGGDTAARGAALAGVADAAIALAEMVPGMDPHLFVPVLCTSDHELSPSRAHGVLVCSTDDLGGVLMQQEETLGQFYVDDVFDRLGRALPSAMFSAGRGSTGVRGSQVRMQTNKTKVRHLPWTPGEQASPAVRAALIAVAVCLVLCPLIGYFVWPVADWAIAMLASLLR